MIRMTGSERTWFHDGRAGRSLQTWGLPAGLIPRQDSDDSFAFPGYGQDFSSAEAEEVPAAVSEGF